MKYKKKPVAIEAFQFDGDLIGMVCCFITGVSEYLAYLQNPLGATLNYLITGR